MVPYKTGFGPFPGEVYHLPFPADYLGVSEADALGALDLCFSADIEPARVAAIIIEPVQGEGGFYVASPSFLQALRKICDQHGILLICDEIQTGFCRTGKTFATEYSGVEPDIMTLAKSLAGGFPLSAVVGKSEIMNAAKPGGLGGTYAGSPIACAAALAVLEVIEEERLNQQALVQGEQIKARLHQLAERFDSIGNIRGPGAMVAMELVKGRDATKPDPDLTKRLVAEAGKRGLVLLACGVRANVIRFLAPLTASPALIDEGLDLLEQALAAASQG
ncbi:5-aminovalerate aminotransferase DavT [compost metagenome]